MEKKKITYIPIYDIMTNRNQPRKVFNETTILALADSIKHNGMISPITVATSQGKNQKYEIVAGERRYRAAKMANIIEVPCIIIKKDEKENAIISLIENIQRENLNMFEEAEAISHLLKEPNTTQEKIAFQIGKAQCTIANKLRILKITPEEREMILKGDLTERHCRELIRLEHPQARKKVISNIIEQNLNVKQTAILIDERLYGDQTQGDGKKKAKNMFYIKDIRLFINTINKAIETMKEAGIKANAKKNATDEGIEYIIKIPVHDNTEMPKAKSEKIKASRNTA